MYFSYFLYKLYIHVIYQYSGRIICTDPTLCIYRGGKLCPFDIDDYGL